jgi:hypothetical protein
VFGKLEFVKQLNIKILAVFVITLYFVQDNDKVSDGPSSPEIEDDVD